MNALISVRHLSFQIGEERILEDVNFQISRGDFVGIIGPNGSGKTTLLKLMLGLLHPDAGEVMVFDQPTKTGKNSHEIGYIPQKVTQLETKFPMTVEEVVRLGRINQRGLFQRLGKNDEKIVTQVLSLVGLTQFRHKRIADLSGGQQQRAFIAKALAGQPKLLILDEPTVGIDMESQESFYALLSELNQKHGLTIVIVSHDLDVVTSQVSSVLCLNKTVIYHGDPKDFLKVDYLEKLYGKNRRFLLHHH
jgi:zinc transport system ATP-binding protein